jgi:hypothetical protein
MVLSVCVCGRFGKAANIFVRVFIFVCCGNMISELCGMQIILQSLNYTSLLKKKMNFVSILYAFINTLKYHQCRGLVELVAVHSL